MVRSAVLEGLEEVRRSEKSRKVCKTEKCENRKKEVVPFVGSTETMWKIQEARLTM